MAIGTLSILIAIFLLGQDGRAALSIGTLLRTITSDTMDTLVPTLGSETSDADLDFMELAAKYGHPAKEYVVYTEDGYRLKVFHLPGNASKESKLPILLFHGVVDSSDTWIIRGETSLAINLANLGYDVWLGNVRGNKYSQGHTSLSLELNATYWNFTFHEHGVYDLPTTIDLVLNETGASKLNVIGHSQGTTISFILLSTKPEYNEKVNLLIALAPVSYLHHAPPPLGIALRLLPEIYGALTLAQTYVLFSDPSPSLALARAACSTTITAYLVCLLGVVYQYTGYDLDQVSPAFSYVAFRHSPTTTTTKNTLHFGQVAIRRSFAQFDYGKQGNMIAYNSDEPPPYKLENVKSKVVLLTARNDYFSAQADVALLRRRLPNVVRFVVNPRLQMNHLDYVWGENMTSYLFPYIFHSLDTYGDG